MQLLTDYMALQEKIFEYFGYAEDRRVIPISDCRECLWAIDGGSVKFAYTPEQWDSDGDCYQDEIYRERLLSKWVYRADEYTMICCDPWSDGNVFLRIFANANEIAA